MQAKVKNRSDSTGAERKTRHPGNLVKINVHADFSINCFQFFFLTKGIAFFNIFFFPQQCYFVGKICLDIVFGNASEKRDGKGSKGYYQRHTDTDFHHYMFALSAT